MYRFLRRPRWIVFTAAIVALMVLMLMASRWQFHRYQDRKDTNAAIDARQLESPVEVTSVVGSDGFDAAADQWRLVSATGTYLADDQVTIANRSYQGQGGRHVVTPLLLDSGEVLLVNRGWIGPDDEAPAPATGRVELVGRLRETQTRGSFGPVDPPDGVLTSMARIDVERLARQIDHPVLAAYAELIESDPPPADGDPLRVGPPAPGNGPHLSYAVQWLIFTACAAAGWLIVVRRTARSEAAALRRAEPSPQPEEVP